MKNHFYYPFLILMVACLFLACDDHDDQEDDAAGAVASEQVSTEKARDAVTGIITKYRTSLAEKDIEGIMSIFSDDAVVMPDDNNTAEGDKQIRQVYSAIIGSANLDYDIQFDLQEVQVFGEAAIARSENSGTITNTETGEVSPVRSRSFFAFTNSDDGWKVYRYMWNGNPPLESEE
jgi:uncharacterized protein (TIGR02246 family)